MGEDGSVRNINAFTKFIYFIKDCFEKPVDWVHDNLVAKNKPDYYWYHEQYRRVPTVDECYIDDLVCIFEADEQYKRDRNVDRNILQILRKRYERCEIDSSVHPERCLPLYQEYRKAVNNYFMKYGDLGMRHSAINCYMKQKHRMAWERRHGPIGTGRKETREQLAENEKTENIEE